MSDPGAKPSVSYWHLYVDDEGVSHQRRCALTQYELEGVGPADPQWNDKMTRRESTVVFTVQPVGWLGDWHENPAPQWIVVLSGRWFIESMDGARIEQGPGEFSFGEDQGCIAKDGRKGHRSGTIGNEPCCLMTVQLHMPINGQQKLGGCYEQASVAVSAESAIGRNGRRWYEAEAPLIGRPDMNSVSRGGPDPTTVIDHKPVRTTVIGVAKQSPVRQHCVRPDVERNDFVLGARLGVGNVIERQRRIRHVESTPAGRKLNSVRLFKIRHSGEFSRNLIKTIDAAMIEVGVDEASLARHQYPERRICKPDRAVRGHGQIIRRIEPLTFKMGDHWLRYGVLGTIGAADATSAVLAMNQRPSLRSAARL